MRVSTRWDQLRPGLRAAVRRMRRRSGRTARATGLNRIMHRLLPATQAGCHRVVPDRRPTMRLGRFADRRDASQATFVVGADGEAGSLLGLAAVR